MKQRISLNYASAHLVVRVEGCEGLNQTLVSVSPPPRQSNNGLVLVDMHGTDNRVGEQFIADKLTEMCELQISEHFTSHKCSMNYSYIALCAVDRFSSCELLQVDAGKLKCDCGRASGKYMNHFFCGSLFLLLIGLSKQLLS